MSIRFPTSVLENHHASLAVLMMENQDTNVLSFLEDEPQGAKKKEELLHLLKVDVNAKP